MLSSYCRNETFYFVFICSAKDLFRLTSNKFRIVYKVDGNLQADSRDWSMYSNILNYLNIIHCIRPILLTRAVILQ